MPALIAGGTVVTGDGSQRADVVIDGERIAAIGTDLGPLGPFDETFDASGKWVIPGAIDAHTHLDLPFAGTHSKDDFATGTVAAAFGGTTTILDFAVQPQGGSLRQGLGEWMRKAAGRSAIDYGFHMIIRHATPETIAEMDELVREGVTDFKLYTAYPDVYYADDGAVFRALRRGASNGALVMLHAENGLAIDVVAEELVAAGHTDPAAYGRSRPAELEGEAVNRVIRLAEVVGAPIYLVHISSRDALDAVRAGRDRGSPVFAETCVQYLFLTDADLGNGFEGAKYVCTPPLRAPEHGADLWRGLVTGDLQVVSTDHCSFDFKGQKEMGRGDFRKIPNGLPGIENRVDLMHDGGVVTGRITAQRWIQLISTEPAKLFGLYPRKGTIAVGSDADLVVYDSMASHTISAATHHMNVDYSPYEGRTVRGKSALVMSRGKVVVRGDEFTGSLDHGRFLKRDISRYLT